MKNKHSKTLAISVLVGCLIVLLSANPLATAYLGSMVPEDAVQIWGDNWNNMDLWLCGGTSLEDTPIDGIYATSGDFPSLVFNSAEFTSGTDYSIYQFGDSGNYPNMWFTMSFDFEGLAQDNFFEAFLLSGKQGETQYGLAVLANTWLTMHNGTSLNATTLTPDASGVADVFMHFDASDGYITTYLNGDVIDNATDLDTSDGVGGFGFQVDCNLHQDDLNVSISSMGAYVPLEDAATPTPGSLPTQAPAGGGGSIPLQVSPTLEPKNQDWGPENTTVWDSISPYLLYAIAAVFALGLFGFAAVKLKHRSRRFKRRK